MKLQQRAQRAEHSLKVDREQVGNNEELTKLHSVLVDFDGFILLPRMPHLIDDFEIHI